MSRYSSPCSKQHMRHQLDYANQAFLLANQSGPLSLIKQLEQSESEFVCNLVGSFFLGGWYQNKFSLICVFDET